VENGSLLGGHNPGLHTDKSAFNAERKVMKERKRVRKYGEKAEQNSGATRDYQ
jgi:hypothetical protein